MEETDMEEKGEEETHEPNRKEEKQETRIEECKEELLLLLPHPPSAQQGGEAQEDHHPDPPQEEEGRNQEGSSPQPIPPPTQDQEGLQKINPLLRMMKKKERDNQELILKEERSKRTPSRKKKEAKEALENKKKETQEDLRKMKTSLKSWMTTSPAPKPKETPPDPIPVRQLNDMTVKNMQKTVEDCVEGRKTVIEEDSNFKKARLKFSQSEKPNQNPNSYENWKKERQTKRKRSSEGLEDEKEVVTGFKKLFKSKSNTFLSCSLTCPAQGQVERGGEGDQVDRLLHKPGVDQHADMVGKNLSDRWRDWTDGKAAYRGEKRK